MALPMQHRVETSHLCKSLYATPAKIKLVQLLLGAVAMLRVCVSTVYCCKNVAGSDQ